MKITETILPELVAQIDNACQRMAELGAPPQALERGAAAGRTLAMLTDDPAQIAGTVAFEASPAGVDPAQLAKALGPEAADIAAQLARFGDLGGTAGWNALAALDAQQADTLRRMLLAVVSDPRLVVARIAVQLARLRAAKRATPAIREALAAEARAVFAPLANRLGIWQVKWELEDLAFRYLQPDDYARIADALQEKREDRERYVLEFCEAVRVELAAAGIVAEVYGRPKHLYSIWRKMQRKQLALSRLYDLRAVRVICNSVPDCYAALGVVHSRWAYIPGEFDDYIATPKENLYRSIHTAVFGPGNHAVEIQIRTREMHEHAELGVAAHWHYKEGGGRKLADDRKIQWVRRILDGRTGGEGDPDFIERARAELFEDRVFALTPKGEVVDLPTRATPLDFAYLVHTGLGHRCRGAKVDGRIVPLTYQLKTGEVVEIITGKQEQPSRDWLAAEQGFLASPRSRAKLRSYFRRLDAGENETAGRSIAERELTRSGLAGDVMPALASDLKAHDVAQLYRWLGEGEVSTTQFAQAVQRRMERASRATSGATADTSRATPAPTAARRSRAGKPASRSASPVVIEGVGDLPVTLARCCAPVRPQAIAGYVTLGRGVTVHEARCRGLARMRAAHPERVLEVNWRSDPDSQLPVEISVSAWDRHGLVRDLSDLIAAENIGIDALNSRTDKSEGIATIVVAIGVRDQPQLARVLRQLSRVSGVISARRTR